MAAEVFTDEGYTFLMSFRLTFSPPSVLKPLSMDSFVLRISGFEVDF
jgi:hypothetical protein